MEEHFEYIVELISIVNTKVILGLYFEHVGVNPRSKNTASRDCQS